MENNSIEKGYNERASQISNGYDALAVAIVKKAADDYRYYAKKWHKARKQLDKRKRLSKEERQEIKIKYSHWEALLRRVEDFFDSQWCSMLINSPLDVEVYIKEKLIKQCQTEGLKRRKR